MAPTPLETLLAADVATSTERQRCRVVVADTLLGLRLGRLHETLKRSAAGDVVAYAVPLTAPAAVRLMWIATLSLRLRWAQWTMERSGVTPVFRYGIEPSLEAPAFAFELNTAASEYADRFLRPRGSRETWRRLAVRCFGFDPAIGAVVVLARKS